MHNFRSAAAALAVAVALSACAGGGSSIPQAQYPQSNQNQTAPQNQAQSQDSFALSPSESAGNPRPMFVALPYKGAASAAYSSSGLPTWSGSFTYSGVPHHYTMLGGNPATTGTTNITTVVIPLAVKIGTKTYADGFKLSNGNSVLHQTLISPIFQSNVDYVQGGTDIGTTQYLDAFQRANFWGKVSKNTAGYHTMLSPVNTVATVTIAPSSANAKSGVAFGANVGLVDINYLDPQLQTIIANLALPATVEPVFLLHNVYLTNGAPSLSNCCIGGYHTYDGVNSYMEATFVDKPGAFSQDVSALSHEVGEWYDDPLVNNSGYCGGSLEVGDPLEGNSNYGGYPYSVGGFTYNLQDLVTLPYFGAPKSTTVHGWSTFQGETLGVCQNGQ